MNGMFPKTAENQEVKRCATVAHGTEDGGKHIIADGGDDTQTDDADIGVSHVKNRIRRIQKNHQGS